MTKPNINVYSDMFLTFYGMLSVS